MEVQITSDIATEPVSYAEMKAYLKLSNDVEQSLITEMIKSARQLLEGYTNRSFGTKTIKVRWNEINGWQELPYSPIISITSMVNDEGDTLTYETRGLEVKQIQVFSTDGVIVQYQAGYSSLPSVLETAIKKQVATMYWNRENYVIGESVNELNDEAKEICNRFSRNTLLGF